MLAPRTFGLSSQCHPPLRGPGACLGLVSTPVLDPLLWGMRCAAGKLMGGAALSLGAAANQAALALCAAPRPLCGRGVGVGGMPAGPCA